MVGSWVGLGPSHVGARPRFIVGVGLYFDLLRFSALCFPVLRLLFCFPLVFEYEAYKIVILQYKWNYVNSKGIYVKSMFISPVLDYNWQLDLVISDHQHRGD